MDPFETLVQMEQDCRQFARPLPSQQPIGRTWQGIGFLSAERLFAVPLLEIKEILAIPKTTPLPASVSWFKGLANLRGHLLPITDLQGFVLDTPQLITAFSRILVINFEKTGIGFLVQKVFGVQRFLQNTFIDSPEENSEQMIDPKFKPYLQGKFKQEEKQWHVLSLKALSQSAEFYRVVKRAEG